MIPYGALETFVMGLLHPGPLFLGAVSNRLKTPTSPRQSLPADRITCGLVSGLGSPAEIWPSGVLTGLWGLHFECLSWTTPHDML